MTPAERKRRFLEAKASRPEPPMALDAIAMREWRRLAGVLRERNALHELTTVLSRLIARCTAAG
jgi:phage terminase small subunit